MVTFLVLNIIMTIVTAGAAIVVTVALAFWNAAVDTTNCVTTDGKCICYNDYYQSPDTYYGENTEFRHNWLHVIVRFSYVLIQLRHDSIKQNFNSWCLDEKQRMHA